MPLPISVCITEAQALLNDLSGDIYTSTSLLPFAKKAFRELMTRLIKEGMPYPTKTNFDPILAVSTPGIPYLVSDMIQPIKMWEKGEGETDDFYVLMAERETLPNLALDTTLKFWSWRTGGIFLIGATTNRIVKAYYRYLPEVDDAEFDISLIANSQTFLASRIAAIAAFVIGANKERADALASDAKDALEELVTTQVKQRQNLPVRRLGYKRRRTTNWFQ
jgi:hypothetical protein